MAISALTVWEVRPATGSDTACSGGFVTGASGTDYSQQAAAQYSLTGLTTAAANAIILSASASADMVGNLIKITGGTNFTTGFYQILSVSLGVSITVDRNVTSAAGAAGTGVIGGALATVSLAKTNAVAGNQIYFKGTYTVSAVLNLAFDSSFKTPFTINGYSIARNDGTRGTWTTATNSINLVDLSGSLNVQFKNINFTNTAGTKGTGTTGNALTQLSSNSGAVLLSQCSFDGFNTAIGGDFSLTTFTFVNLQMDGVEIKNSVSHGVFTTCSAACSGCWFHANGGDGFRITDDPTHNGAYNYTSAFVDCVFYGNTGHGLNNLSDQTASATVGGNVMLILIGCDFVLNGGDGVRSPANQTGSTMAWNNIFWNNTGWGYNSPTSNALVNALPRCNAYGSNTAGARQNFPVGVGDVALSADPFTSIGTDFSLNATAGGGTACKGAGFGAFVFGTGHADIGAVQSAGTTTTNVFSPASNIFIFDTEEG